MTGRLAVASFVVVFAAFTATVRGEEPASALSGCAPLSMALRVLPQGPEGVPYSFTIPTYGGRQPVKMQITAGAFPPGLSLSPTGKITGIPTAAGSFEFTVTAADSCLSPRQRVSRSLKLVISGGGAAPIEQSVITQQQMKLSVITTPATVAVVPGKSAEGEITYQLTALPAGTATLTSPGGTFSVAGAVIESVPAFLSVAVINGSATVSEKITVPKRVLEQARRTKADITFSRPFSGRQTTALAVVKFTTTNGGESGHEPK